MCLFPIYLSAVQVEVLGVHFMLPVVSSSWLLSGTLLGYLIISSFGDSFMW